MLYLFLIIIVLGLLAAMLTVFVKLIRDLGELAALMRASGSGTEKKTGGKKPPPKKRGGGGENPPHPSGRYYLQEKEKNPPKRLTGVITKTKTVKTGKNLSTK